MSKKVAFGGILLALNIILLLLINIIPMNTLFIMGLASLPISIIIMEFGPKSGVIFYIGSIILGFLVMANKFQWILYTTTFGIYGLIKYMVERDLPIYIEYILKLLFANIIMLVLYLTLKQFIYIPVNLIIIVIFEIVFVIYDNVYSSFIGYYNDKLRRLIKNL